MFDVRGLGWVWVGLGQLFGGLGWAGSMKIDPWTTLGGPDGITPQHIRDLLTGSTDENLQEALVDFVNLMLAGTFDKEVNSIIFRGRLIVLSKKGVGIRPISVGYTLRWLAAKCVNNHVIAKCSKALQSQQLGAGFLRRG